MKLFQLADGSYVGTQDEGRKSKQTFVQVEVPTDKDGLIGYLNGLNSLITAPRPVRDGPPPLSQSTVDTAERLANRMGATFVPDEPYVSPLTARSTIAGIDAVMISQAVEQMQGEELAKVVHSAINRMHKLALRIDPDAGVNDLLS